jgi:lysozyme
MSALEQIKIDEGFRGKPYKCTAGKVTIGFGRNLDDNPLTRAEAEFLLNNDLKKVAKQASRFGFYQKLNTTRRAVIINMIFNLGLSRFSQFKKMISALESNDYAEAATQMLDSKWAKQVGDRAIRLSKEMRQG